MTISRNRPPNELVSLKDAMGRLIEDSFYMPHALFDAWNSSGTMPLDMYEDDDTLVVKASLPGVKPEDLNIEVRGNILTISGESRQEMERREDKFYLNERRSGQFRRSLPLPYEVKVDRIEAEFEDGVLTMTLPKAETAKVKKISVKTQTKAKQPKAKARQQRQKAKQAQKVTSKTNTAVEN
jgi:HSP20 family protein